MIVQNQRWFVLCTPDPCSISFHRYDSHTDRKFVLSNKILATRTHTLKHLIARNIDIVLGCPVEVLASTDFLLT